MSLHPVQFLKSRMHETPVEREVPKYAIGEQVHDEGGRPGIVTAHHVDHVNYNVMFGRGKVDVKHENDLR